MKITASSLAFIPYFFASLLVSRSSLAIGMDIPPIPSFPSLESQPSEIAATSLRVAAREGRWKRVQELLDRGADVNSTGEFGETALMYAARWNHFQVVDVLLANNADPDAKDSRESSALIEAAKNCSFRVSEQLLARHAQTNLTDIHGKSALTYASEGGCPQIVQQLLKTKHLELNLKDMRGRTALDYALEEAQTEVGGNYTDIVRMLRKAGGKSEELQIIELAPSPHGDQHPVNRQP